MKWLNNYSWIPDLLLDKRPLSQASEQEPVEPDTIQRASVHIDPQPGSNEYLRLGCDHLYTDLGGEG